MCACPQGFTGPRCETGKSPLCVLEGDVCGIRAGIRDGIVFQGSAVRAENEEVEEASRQIPWAVPHGHSKETMHITARGSWNFPEGLWYCPGFGGFISHFTHLEPISTRIIDCIKAEFKFMANSNPRTPAPCLCFCHSGVSSPQHRKYAEFPSPNDTPMCPFFLLY